MLYGACRRAAFAMGYRRIITYTQADETGASLRGAGFDRVKELAPRASWAQSSVKLHGLRDPVGSGGVGRVLWQDVRCAGRNGDYFLKTFESIDSIEKPNLGG